MGNESDIEHRKGCGRWYKGPQSISGSSMSQSHRTSSCFTNSYNISLSTPSVPSPPSTLRPSSPYALNSSFSLPCLYITWTKQLECLLLSTRADLLSDNYLRHYVQLSRAYQYRPTEHQQFSYLSTIHHIWYPYQSRQ